MDLTTFAAGPSGVPDPPGPKPDSRARDVAAQFEGLLFAQALSPMTKSCGFLGDSIVAIVATDLARHDHGALATTLARAIDSARAGEGFAR